MSVAIEILKQDSLDDIREAARQLTQSEQSLGSQLNARKSALQNVRQKLVDNGLGNDDRVTEIDAWVGWIEQAQAALGQLPEKPKTLV